MKPFLFAALGVACCVSAAEATVVQRVFWNPRLAVHGDVDPFPGQTTDPALATPGDLTQVGITRTGGGTGSMGFGNIPTGFSDDHYIQFSVLPGAGQQLDVHDLFMQIGDGNSNPISPVHVLLRTSLDGFTADIAAAAGPGGLQGNFGRPVVFDLEALPQLTQETTFRLYVADTPGNAFGIFGSITTNGHGIWFSNIDATELPTPGALGVLALGGAIAGRRRR